MPTRNLVPQLVHDTTKTEILKNILSTGESVLTGVNDWQFTVNKP